MSTLLRRTGEGGLLGRNRLGERRWRLRRHAPERGARSGPAREDRLRDRAARALGVRDEERDERRVVLGRQVVDRDELRVAARREEGVLVEDVGEAVRHARAEAQSAIVEQYIRKQSRGMKEPADLTRRWTADE